MSTTEDPKDPGLSCGIDTRPGSRNAAYLVLPAADRAMGFVRPLRQVYRHLPCNTTTRMDDAVAETIARRPGFYGGAWCEHCRMHRPLSEFVWDGSEDKVGS